MGVLGSVGGGGMFGFLPDHAGDALYGSSALPLQAVTNSGSGAAKARTTARRRRGECSDCVSIACLRMDVRRTRKARVSRWKALRQAEFSREARTRPRTRPAAARGACVRAHDRTPR